MCTGLCPHLHPPTWGDGQQGAARPCVLGEPCPESAASNATEMQDVLRNNAPPAAEPGWAQAFLPAALSL